MRIEGGIISKVVGIKITVGIVATKITKNLNKNKKVLVYS